MCWKVGTAFLSLALLFVGCSPATQDPGATLTPSSGSSTRASDASSALQGTVKIDGSSTVFPISESAASSFHEKYPNVDVTVGKKGTGGGFSEFVKGEIDISDASRPIKSNELAECNKNQIKFLELPIAYDGLAICVHPENKFIDEISIEDLRRIFSDGVKLKTWKEINADYPDEPIKIFMPGTDSGTFDFFKEVVVGKEGFIRSDVTPSEEDLVLVNGIAAEKYGIGFFGASYFFENRDRIKALKVVNPATKQGVEPSVKNIEESVYAPLGRPLFIYVNVNSIKRPEVKRFVEYYLDNAAKICEAAKCVPLSGDLYKLVRQRFDDRLDGSYFYDSEGKSRSGQLSEVYVESHRIPMQ
jgi:phosphate transport system substrate-binding protein